MHLEVNGTRLWFDVDGSGLVPDGPRMQARPTVVLLHGGPGSYDHSYFKPDFARLAQVAQVVYLDLRGHGRSTHADPAAWSIEACADDVRALCDALGIVRPVVLGHSLGGMVALLYAARHPGHAGALVLQSTMARFDLQRLVDGFRRVGGDEVADIAARSYAGDPSVSAEEWDRCRLRMGPWVPGEQERGRIVVHRALGAPGMERVRGFDVRDQLSRVECPTLVRAGDLDPVTPVAAAEEIADALPSGTAQLEVIEGTGHFAWRDAPDRYWPRVIDFVAGAAAR